MIKVIAIYPSLTELAIWVLKGVSRARTAFLGAGLYRLQYISARARLKRGLATRDYRVLDRVPRVSRE